MYEIRRYRIKKNGTEFIGLRHRSGPIVDLGFASVFTLADYQVEPIPDPVPEFAEAREKLDKLQRLLLDGKIPHCLSTIRPLIAEHRGWQCEVVDGISCWVPPPPKSPLELAIELAEPLAEKMDGPVYLDPDRLKLLVDAARKQLAAEKGGGA